MRKFILFLVFFFCFNEYAFSKATLKQTVSAPHNNDRFYRGITFNNDGTKMYVTQSQSSQSTGSGIDKVLMYELSTPYDVSTITDNNVEQRVRYACDHTGGNMSGGSGLFRNPGGVRFNNDGTKIFFANRVDANNINDTCELTLTTPYDITTVKEDGSGNEVYHGFELEAGDTDVSDTGADDAYGLAFNNDGTRLFITHYGSVFKVYQFDLSTGFDFSTSKYNGVNFSTNTDGSETPTGIQFSKDGYQMFVVDHEDDSIYQWSLSTAFDLSTTVTFRGTLNMLSDYQSHSATTSSKTEKAQDLEFNNDGSKVIVTFDYGAAASASNAQNSQTVIIEYELDCPYGIVYCESPVSGSDKDMIGVLEAYTEMSKRVMKNSINPVMHRLEWLRRHRKDNDLTNQNLKFNFSNEMLASLAKVIPVGNKESSTNEEQKGDWFYWSEGQVSIGDIGATINSSTKEINTSSITFGADKKVSENKFYGYALQLGKDSSDVGSSAALLDTDNYSLVFYGTLPHEDGRFLDAALGVSALNTNHIRTKNSIKLNGSRNGKQIFGSIKLNNIYQKNEINFNPTARIDLGFTELSTFQESGSVAALIYNKHQILKGLASVGMQIDNTKTFSNGNVLKPMVRLDYISDFSPSTNTNVSYVSKPNADYFVTIGNESSHNYRAGLGFDLSTVTGWSTIFNYERQNANGSGHSDNLYFTTGWVPNKKTEYALILNTSDDVNASLNINKNIKGLDVKFAFENDIFSKKKNQKANIFLSKVF